MASPPGSPTAGDLLAVLSRHSVRRGDAALARTRLTECLTSIITAGSARSASVAMDAAAELAETFGQPERAVEFYGARDRIARRTKATEPPEAAERRAQALARIGGVIGAGRYDEAWARSRATPYPVEFYLSAVLRWLEDLERESPVAGAGPGAPADEATTMGTTAHLIARVREGSSEAKEQLTRRYLDPLRRFARGRLPDHARGMVDTDDLVQTTLIRGLEKAGTIPNAKKGGFFAYLRMILINQVRDEIRRNARRPRPTTLSESVRSSAPSPLDAVLEAETFETYRAALSRLPRRQRDVLRLRIEYGLSYQEVADEAGCRTANAARMLVSRALESVTKSMQRTT